MFGNFFGAIDVEWEAVAWSKEYQAKKAEVTGASNATDLRKKADREFTNMPLTDKARIKADVVAKLKAQKIIKPPTPVTTATPWSKYTNAEKDAWCKTNNTPAGWAKMTAAQKSDCTAWMEATGKVYTAVREAEAAKIIAQKNPTDPIAQKKAADAAKREKQVIQQQALTPTEQTQIVVAAKERAVAEAAVAEEAGWWAVPESYQYPIAIGGVALVILGVVGYFYLRR